MAKIDLTISSLGDKFVDIRDSIPGDSYNWSWTRPLAQVKYLAIHHTAGPDTQTPEQIANFHIHSNGWGGIGYHFLIAKGGTVYYVGDISTARANVANLNEQVLGICLMGNFMNGSKPTDLQVDSVRKLCDFFINHYPALVNVQSWDGVRGHKDLPGQATACPGDTWPEWRSRIITGTNNSPGNDGGIVFNGSSDRTQKISDLYRTVLGREPDVGGLQTYVSSPASVEEIMKSMVTSGEHKNLLDQVKQTANLQSQVAALQDTVNRQKQQIQSLDISNASLSEQVELLNQQVNQQPETNHIPTPEKPQDTTFTLVDALFNLYELIRGKIANRAL